VLQSHSDQVLHISFSHDGQLFATTSKDGFIKVCTVHLYCFHIELQQQFDQPGTQGFFMAASYPQCYDPAVFTLSCSSSLISQEHKVSLWLQIHNAMILLSDIN